MGVGRQEIADGGAEGAEIGISRVGLDDADERMHPLGFELFDGELERLKAAWEYRAHDLQFRHRRRPCLVWLMTPRPNDSQIVPAARKGLTAVSGLPIEGRNSRFQPVPPSEKASFPAHRRATVFHRSHVVRSPRLPHPGSMGQAGNCDGSMTSPKRRISALPPRPWHSEKLMLPACSAVR